MRIWTAAALALGLLAFPSAALAQTKAELVEFGIYRAETIETEIRPNGIGWSTVAEPTLLKKADKFPAALGRSFGIRFKVSSDDGAVNVRRVVIYPKPGVRPQPKGAPIPFVDRDIVIGSGMVTYAGYTFDRDWEMLPGPWKFQVWDGGHLLLEKTIIITEPEGPPIS